MGAIGIFAFVVIIFFAMSRDVASSEYSNADAL